MMHNPSIGKEDILKYGLIMESGKVNTIFSRGTVNVVKAIGYFRHSLYFRDNKIDNPPSHNCYMYTR